MENFNKVLSFILGFVVVVVFIIVLSGRLNLRDRFLPLQTEETRITPTPTPKQVQEQEEPGFFERLFGRAQPTSTPTPQPVKKKTEEEIATTNYQTGQPIEQRPTLLPTPQTKGGVSKVRQIPATGSPSILIPLLGSAALLGFYLRRRK